MEERHVEPEYRVDSVEDRPLDPAVRDEIVGTARLASIYAPLKAHHWREAYEPEYAFEAYRWLRFCREIGGFRFLDQGSPPAFIAWFRFSEEHEDAVASGYLEEIQRIPVDVLASGDHLYIAEVFVPRSGLVYNAVRDLEFLPGIEWVTYHRRGHYGKRRRRQRRD